MLAAVEGTADSTRLMLAYDGEEPDDARSLQDMGVQASETVYFTGVVYHPQALVIMEITKIRRETVARSRAHAAEARRILAEKREQLLAERKQQVEVEFEESRQQEGPVLMLANEPACALTASKSSDADCQDTAFRAALTDGPKVVPDLKVQAKGIAAAYSSFFDHISFRKGWKEPPFTLSEVGSAFESAARVVARVRVEVLDVRDPGFKIRQVEGCARDWMHSPECATLLHDDPKAFAEGLVHATFKDANGYVERLTHCEVDELVKLYM